MADTPNLVIQLQRMGDLVLSFPLFSWLARLEPQNPVWVVAEPVFYEALMPLSPSVVFFPPQAEPQLRGIHFRRVINLSHRPEAARLAGVMRAESHLGALTRDGETHVAGAWRLYRASLAHNNRHNRLHWADLNALDVVPAEVMLRSVWPLPRSQAGTGRVGLFVGASEAAKRPEPEFWAKLAAQLTRRGYRPVFLGGTAELPLGAEAARLASLPLSNLCGRFSLPELVRFLAELDLLVTPDTGPMHVGAWTGTPTLNLSMGPVNAWETAPFPPGHMVLHPASSCTGCWHCERTDGKLPPPCKNLFVPERIASLIHALLRGKNRLPTPPGLRLRQTRRSGQGLFELTSPTALAPAPHIPECTGASRDLLGEFWKQWFLDRLGGPASLLPTALRDLDNGYPHGLETLRRGLPPLQTRFAAALRGETFPGDFWRQTPPLLRPLAGYLQLLLENGDFHRSPWHDALELLEHLATVLRS